MRANPRDVDAILARFPGPVTLYPSRRKLIGMLAIALGFVTISILLLRGKPADSATWMIWACLLFFGACALIGIVMLLPGAASLTLTAEGFEVVSLFRCMRTPWSAASGFAPTQLPPLHAPRVRGHAMVGYELADFAQRVRRFQPQHHRAQRGAARHLRPHT